MSAMDSSLALLQHLVLPPARKRWQLLALVRHGDLLIRGLL